jgi:hypothetical protein
VTSLTATEVPDRSISNAPAKTGTPISQQQTRAAEEKKLTAAAVAMAMPNHWQQKRESNAILCDYFQMMMISSCHSDINRLGFISSICARAIISTHALLFAQPSINVQGFVTEDRPHALNKLQARAQV